MARVVEAPAAAPAADILNAHCPSRTVLRHVTDRWAPMIMSVLGAGPARFGELREAVQGISPKVLTQTLRSMERDGLISREVTAQVPVRVDYALTELGRSAAEPIAALRRWAEEHVEVVEANRERFDALEAARA